MIHLSMICTIVYGAFTMETTLATAFGRMIDVQKGESVDEFTKAVDSVFQRTIEGQSLFVNLLLVLFSKLPK